MNTPKVALFLLVSAMAVLVSCDKEDMQTNPVDENAATCNMECLRAFVPAVFAARDRMVFKNSLGEELLFTGASTFPQRVDDCLSETELSSLPPNVVYSSDDTEIVLQTRAFIGGGEGCLLPSSWAQFQYMLDSNALAVNLGVATLQLGSQTDKMLTYSTLVGTINSNGSYSLKSNEGNKGSITNSLVLGGENFGPGYEVRYPHHLYRGFFVTPEHGFVGFYDSTGELYVLVR